MTTAKIIDVSTGEETEIEYTAEQIEKLNAEAKAYAEAEAEEAAAKEAEKQRIAGALGLTLDELKVLLS